MARGVFLHREDSRYDDLPAERYQFPAQYLSRAAQFVRGWVVYYFPLFCLGRGTLPGNATGR
jgi:putative restriction endonuclease